MSATMKRDVESVALAMEYVDFHRVGLAPEGRLDGTSDLGQGLSYTKGRPVQSGAYWDGYREQAADMVRWLTVNNLWGEVEEHYLWAERDR